ncbi:MAG: sialidase family protein [Gemmatimonadaceae bacterium]
MWCNTQVTYSPTTKNSRSESELEANPLDPRNLVGASKRFIDPTKYKFTLAAYASFDGGESWTEAPPLQLLSNWAGISDPAIAWDNAGNCYLVALPFPPAGNSTHGIAVYKSSDGGLSWSSPSLIHTSSGDDKQWATGDRNTGSRFFGNVYAAWDDGSSLAFARTTDQGATWRGTGTQPAGSVLAVGDSFAPVIAVANDGAVYIFWLATNVIKYVKSIDGGNSFTIPPRTAVSGLTSISAVLPRAPDFSKFPGTTFRVMTLPTACCGSARNVVVAWADYREGVSRIYYRRSSDGGTTWVGATSGQPLLTRVGAPGSDQHDFHPQLASTPSGAIACSYYELGPKWSGAPPWINVMIATSQNAGASFLDVDKVSNVPWDPAVNAPLSHGMAGTTFIGEYFGLAASSAGFVPFWTDTRTGMQEIFSGRKMTIGPWNGVQFQGKLPAGSTRRWFTFNWPACWHVVWEIVPITPRVGAPQIKWRVQVERATSGTITYWLKVTNLTGRDVDIEGRYSILAAD